jgi:iron complex outermembrane receptor protein
VPEKRQKTADCLAILPLFSYRRRLVNRKSNNSNPGFGELMILRNKTVSLRLSVAASICLLAQSAWAQVPDNDKLDEIVVTATRMETTVRNAARSISVVGKERIQLGTQQLGLDEALAAVPGLYMQNRYNFAQDLRVSLRGFGARSSFGIRGIKVIVDGIPETLPDGQAGVDSIDLGSASSIEILRGPASSLYGNASGGVISIMSELGSDNPYVEGRVAGGDYSYSQYQLKSAGKVSESDYLFNISRTEIDGYRDHSNARGSVLNTKLGVPIGQSDKLIFALNLTDQPEAQDPGGINAAQSALDPSSARDRNVQFDAGESLEQQRFGVVYQRYRDSGNLTLRNYYAWREFANKLPFVGGGSVDLDRFFYGVGAQYSFGRLPDPFSLTVGIDYDRQDDDRTRFDNNDGVLGPVVFDQNENVDNVGLFAQAQYEFNDKWALLGGLRYDELSYDVTDRYLVNGDDSGQLDFDQVSPSIALNYRMESGVLFASYSSSFETPTTTELANPDGSGGFNPLLNPQTADNFEIGYKRSAGNLYYELALFTISLEDELIPFELAAFPGRTFYSNAGSSTRDGIETSISWETENGFRVDASYTWSDFKFDDFVDDNGNDFSGNRLPGLPEHFAYVGLSYAGDTGFIGTLEAFYSGDLYANNANTADVSSYTIANFRLAYEFDTGPWLIRPYLGVNNLFDESYNSNIRINAFGGRYFEPAPERNYYAGVVVNFSKTR